MELEHLSPSRIKTFYQCQLQYHAKYDLKIEEPPPHPLTTMGLAVHQVFEDGFNEITNGRDYDFVSNIGPICNKLGVSLENALIAKTLVENAIKWGYLRNIDRCIGVEVPFLEELPDGTKVKGLIDRLDYVPEIIDLKTQKREFDDVKSQWQSKIYNWALRKIRPEFSEDTVRMSYWVLRHRVQRCELTASDANEAEGLLMSVADEIRSCDDPKAYPSALCQWCLYREKCPSANLSRRERFNKYKRKK